MRHTLTAVPARRQIVTLRGALTAASADRLLDSLRSVQPTPGRVEIDLSRVTSVNRAGATLLLDAYVVTVLRRSAFAIRGLSAACRTSLERFGVLDVVEIIDTDTPDDAAPKGNS